MNLLFFQERNLVDMCCTDSEVWAIWRSGDGDECVKHLTYDGSVPSVGDTGLYSKTV